MSELKPCPFCGGEAEWQEGKTGDGKPWHFIACSKCEAMAPYVRDNKEKAVEAWNTRADMDKAIEQAKRETADKCIKIYIDNYEDIREGRKTNICDQFKAVGGGDE